MDISLIPTDVLVKTLCYLGTAHDVGNAAQVCWRLRRAAEADTLWREMAHHRYGARIAEMTLPLYNHSYRLMMLDENRRGALPTLNGLWKCLWKYNNPRCFFCCLITSIKWHRPSHEIWIYVDARGESDLKEPQHSGLWRDCDTYSNTRTIPHLFESELTVQPPRGGHYKGKIRMRESLFREPGEYRFCYANEFDYLEVLLFTIRSGQSLEDVLCSYSLVDESPFENDTEEIELDRWVPHVPGDLFNRTNNRWWV